MELNEEENKNGNVEEVVDIVKELENFNVKGIIEEVISHQEDRRPGLHVSNASYECSRKLFFDYTEPRKTLAEEGEKWKKDIVGMYKVWIGQELHKTPLSDGHETELILPESVLGLEITGSVDEIFIDSRGGSWIVDKKFVGYAPNFVMQPHHRKQVGFYAWMLKEVKGIEASGVILAYTLIPEVYRRKSKKEKESYDPTKDTITRYFAEKLTPEDIEAFGKELKEMVSRVVKGLETWGSTELGEGIPEKNITWYCQYCDWRSKCFPNEEAIKSAVEE